MSYNRPVIPGSDILINLLTLSFSPEIEKVYKDIYFDRSIGHVRIATAIGLFFYSMFGLLDWIIVPEVRWSLWFIRFAIFLPIVSGILAFSFNRLFKDYMQPCIAVIILSGGLGIVAMIIIAPYPRNYSYYVGLILVFMFGYTFFKHRFIWASVTGWILVLAYEVTAIWPGDTPWPVLIGNNFFFLSSNIVGMFACYSIEFMTRRDFAQARMLELEREKVSAANRELEQRVAERTAQLYQANTDLKAEMDERLRAQEALRESEQLFRSLSENAPDIIYTLDLEGHFTYVNPAWERLLGHTPAEVLGRYFVQFAPPGTARRYIRRFREIRDKQLTFSDVDGELVARDGAIRHFSMAGSPNFDSQGRIIGLVGLFKDISPRRRAEQEVRIQKAYLEQLIENAPEAIVLLDNAGQVVRVNEEFCRLFGYCAPEALGSNIWDLVTGPGQAGESLDLTMRAATGQRIQTEAVRMRKDGTPVCVSILATPIVTEDGQVGVYGIYRDITERKKSEEALRESEEKHRTVLQASPDPVVVYDMEGQVLYLNPAYTRVFGWTIEERFGRKIETCEPSEECENIRHLMAQVMSGQSLSGNEIRRATKDGRVIDVSVSGAVFHNTRNEPQGFVITFQDITSRKQTEEQLKYLAYHDLLTGLPNRKSFYEHMEDLLIQAQRRKPDPQWALLFLDLDRFKDVNDALGHDVGDQLLKEVAERIGRCLRRSDFLHRLGGDEFTIILSNLAQDIDAAKVANNIIEAVACPFHAEGAEIYPAVSIGISLYPGDGRGVEVLVKNADMAMYAAKEHGNQYRFFTEEMNVKALERVRLESRLRHALEKNQFEIHYQPLVDAQRRVLGVEALLRWHEPEMGLVSPARFVPVAEDTGAIIPIGEWVLRQACRQVKKWHQEGGPQLYVAVNLSPRQFGQGNLVEVVLGIIEETGLEPHYLKLEVTESSVMENPEDAIAKMKRLYERGIRFSIDDFGTGYSSLSYLKRFPVDTLKIDRSFVRDVTCNQDDQEIIKTIIAMARSLRISTVAEGVETVEQQDFLSQQGCQIMQGYYFGRPQTSEAISRLLQEQTRSAPAE